jgi:hypothetical protein
MNPSPEPAAAFRACGAQPGSTRQDAITGMGLIARADEVTRYTYLWGSEPEIQRANRPG